MSWYAHITVATIVTQNNMFLLVHENTENGQVYNQPAGHLEPNETLVEAAIRETLEETRWHIKPITFLGIKQYTSPINNITYIRTTFIAHPEYEDTSLPLTQILLNPCGLLITKLSQENQNCVAQSY